MMELSWAVQVLLAAASVVMDRKDVFFPPGSSDTFASSNSSESSSDSFGDSPFATRSSHRQARLFALPIGGQIICGLIFGVPIALMLPVVRKRQPPPPPPPADDSAMMDDDSMGGDDGDAMGNDPESANQQENQQGDDGGNAGNVDGRSWNDQDKSIPSLDEDLLYEEQLAKLDRYFHFMELTSEKCKRRMICEVAAAAEDFYPVSDIILRQMKPKTPVNPASKSRFSRFLEAAKLGFNGDLKLCAKKHKCSVGGGDVLDYKMLQIFQLLGRQLNLKFIDR